MHPHPAPQRQTLKLSFATSGKEVAQGTDLREACVNLLLQDLDNALGVFQVLDCDGNILKVPDQYLVWARTLPQSRYTHLNEAQVVRRDPPEVVILQDLTSKPVVKVQMSPGMLLFWQDVYMNATHTVVQEVVTEVAVTGRNRTTQLNVKWLNDLKISSNNPEEQHNFSDTWMPKSVLALVTCRQCNSFTTMLGAKMNLWDAQTFMGISTTIDNWSFWVCYQCEEIFKVHCQNCHLPLNQDEVDHLQPHGFESFYWCRSCTIYNSEDPLFSAIR